CGEVAVAWVARSTKAAAGYVECAVHRGQSLGLEPDPDAGSLRHLVRVAEEPEPRHVGNRVRFERSQRVGRVAVEGAHPANRAFELHLAGLSPLEAGHDQT